MTNIETLNKKLRKWLGSYIHTVYHSPPSIQINPTTELFEKPVLKARINNQVGPDQEVTIVQLPSTNKSIEVAIANGALATTTTMFMTSPINHTTTIATESYSQQEMLRDLFLWSVFMDLSEMAKVLLSHMNERICASLIAAKIFKNYSNNSATIDMRDRLQRQVVEFEIYSAKCVEKCYACNEVMSCELLLREVPLFGNVTCMQVGVIIQIFLDSVFSNPFTSIQVAISGENAKFLETPCFAHVLDQILA